MKNKITTYLGLTIFFLQIAVACSLAAQPNVIAKTPVTKNTEVVITPTFIPSPSPTPSLAPLPTLTSEEKLDRVGQLQKNNGGCNFPCWWGVTPGVTTWDEAAKILSPIALKNLVFTIENGNEMYYLEFPDVSRNIIVDIFVQNNGVVDVIRIGWDYPLVDFLRDYSTPREIWISSDGVVPGPSLFRIAFFYPEKGFMIVYLGKSSLILHEGIEYIKMCVTDFNSSGPLWLWNSNFNKRFDELPIENLTGLPPTNLRFKRIGEYTNFDETSFFNSVAGNSEMACLETRADIWPNPDLYKTPTP